MPEKKWKKLARKKLLEHPRLSVYEDHVELPSGHQTTYVHFGKSHDAATVIAIDDKDRFLVQKEYSYPTDTWLYQFPGGMIEPGETPEQGAIRELAEEAQVTGDLRPLGWYFIEHRRRPSRFYIFEAQNLSETVSESDIEEEFETYWLTANEIESMIRNGEIVNAAFLSAWAIYKSQA